MEIDLNKGDAILGGKWKNKKDTVKSIGKDDSCQPTINNKPMLKFKIVKAMPKKSIQEDEKEQWQVTFYNDYEETPVTQLFNSELEAKNWADDYEYDYSDIIIDDEWKTFYRYFNPENEQNDYKGYTVEMLKSPYLKEKEIMPLDLNKLGTSAGAQVKDKFVSELSFALRDAFNEFLNDMNRYSISKDDSKFQSEYLTRMPSNLDTELKSLYYKYTVGKYQYLNSVPYEQFVGIVKKDIMKVQAIDFYSNLKTTTLRLSQLIGSLIAPSLPSTPTQPTKPGTTQESMEESVKLKAKILIEKILAETRLSKKIVNEDIDGIADEEMEESTELTEYKTPKDNSTRPSRMTRPDINGMTKNAKAYWSHLYIQDEAEDIFQDKYGKERGTKAWEGSINSRFGGAMYQAVTEIVMQKSKMYNDLRERLPSDYFDESWFSVWKRWMASKGKPYEAKPEVLFKSKHNDKISTLTVPKPLDTITTDKSIPTLKDLTKPKVSTLKPISTTSGYDRKDGERIDDIVTYAKGDKSKETRLAQIMAGKITDKQKAIRRGNAAEDRNYHNLASIFYKRAAQL